MFSHYNIQAIANETVDTDEYIDSSDLELPNSLTADTYDRLGVKAFPILLMFLTMPLDQDDEFNLSDVEVPGTTNTTYDRFGNKALNTFISLAGQRNQSGL